MARPRDRLGPGLTISTLLLSALLSPAGAIPVVEGEAPRAAANDSPGGARVIPESAFTTPAPPPVFDPPGFATATVWGQAGGPDVDFYAFAGSGRVALDVDDDPFTLDLVLALFDGAGTLLAFSDDSGPADPGSADSFDPFLGLFALPAPGTYLIGLAQFPREPATLADCASWSPLTRPDGADGGLELAGCPSGADFAPGGPADAGPISYALHISLENPTLGLQNPNPSPAAPVRGPSSLVALGAGLAAAGAVTRRRLK